MAHLDARPLTLKQANAAVSMLHRHHKPVVGHRFSIGAYMDENLVGCVIVGRPVARKTAQYSVAEVTRLATDGTKNACSFLYARAANAAKAMGFDEIQTFILETEPGTTLVAAGWSRVGVAGQAHKTGWNNRAGRRHDQPQCPKVKFRKVLK